MTNHPNRNKRLLALEASHVELLVALKAIIVAEEMPCDLQNQISNGAYFRAYGIALENARAAIARAESLTTTNRG